MSFGGFSWKRVLGITKAKRKIARVTGIPTTKAGRRRKAQSFLWKAILGKPKHHLTRAYREKKQRQLLSCLAGGLKTLSRKINRTMTVRGRGIPGLSYSTL